MDVIFLPNFHVVFIGIFSQLVTSVIYREANVFVQLFFCFISIQRRNYEKSVGYPNSHGRARKKNFQTQR